MRAVRLGSLLLIYYIVVFAAGWVILSNFPQFREYLPIGGAEQLINPSGKTNSLQAVVETNSVRTLGQSIGWLATAILGALLTALPVSWVYMSTRTAEEYDQSLISSIIILPVVVTSIVIVVQHSLALAFALGGIAGAVRFKNSLKSSGDALYILLSVGIGLASGIGAVELALVMSIGFNLCFVLLWVTEFGEREGMKRYMLDFDDATTGSVVTPTAAGSAPPPPAPGPTPPSIG
ncbi:DUF4956 domain-containing protein [Sphingomonas edaphi]|jgi:hypothetical protein|uniref:DUF4956 domain-containing protein n=1 Tax=Sphingomonas edaphi TaxID=2315689 RepID=A0A418Q1R6_9SPHN|nr:DUF4956 domain-containing protein [Sphingomonas edaphi]RIX31986.1 DUF4956 domain-containing protein [Sphingomonas edaphi]